MSTRRLARALALVVLSLTPTLVLGETVTATRLVVADHRAPLVLLLDEAGIPILRLETAEPARLSEGMHSGQVALRESHLGRVTLLETGLRVEGHGDHGDLRIGPPRRLPIELLGPRPSHIVASDGLLAVFFDGDGSVLLVESPDGTPPRRLSAAHAHHGVAFPYLAEGGPRIAISEAPAAGERPAGVVVRDVEGREVVRSADCPRLHGEARTGATIAFGCADGLLLLDTRTGTFRKIANPPEAGQRMVRNLAGGEDWRLFFGDFGPDAMVVVDPDAGAMRVVRLPARRLHFALDRGRSDTGFVLTEDGMLHAVALLDGAIRASIQATGRYSLEGGAAVARPRLSAGGGIVAISDPANGRVLLHDGDTLALRRVIETGGAPFDIRLVSLTGERH